MTKNCINHFIVIKAPHIIQVQIGVLAKFLNLSFTGLTKGNSNNIIITTQPQESQKIITILKSIYMKATSITDQLGYIFISTAIKIEKHMQFRLYVFEEIFHA